MLIQRTPLVFILSTFFVSLHKATAGLLTAPDTKRISSRQRDLVPMDEEGLCYYSNMKRAMYCQLWKAADNELGTLDIPANLWEVTLRNCKIKNVTNLDEYLLSQQPNLKTLNLAYNHIRFLPEDTFKNNLRISELILRNNKISVLPSKIFQGLTALETLDLSNNKLWMLPSDLFIGNARLLNLQLWANQLTTLPERIFRKNFDLKKLTISWNKLETIPPAVFHSLLDLEWLVLYKNNLRCLEPTTFEMNTRLKELDLAYNDLRIMPDDLFASNYQLAQIGLWANSLECVPKGLFKEQQDLTYVSFQTANYGISTHLRKRFHKQNKFLDMTEFQRRLRRYGTDSCHKTTQCEWDPLGQMLDCSYKDLINTDTLRGLNGFCEPVRHLRLNDNQLTNAEDLADALGEFENVETVEIQNNQFQNIDPRMLEKNKNLISLDMSRNHVMEIPEKLFQNNSYLQSVKIANNYVYALPEHLFDSNFELVQLDMTGNILEELPPKSFGNNAMLETVQLGSNKLRNVEKDTFESNPKLRRLELDNNMLDTEMKLKISDYAEDLEVINLRANNLKEIQLVHETPMIRVRIVDLSKNRLKYIPRRLLKLAPYTEELYLGRNKISKLDTPDLAMLTFLKTLDLSENVLRDFEEDDVFHQNVLLETLILDSNTLYELPERLLANAHELRVFSATGNQISSISNNFFRDCPRLEEVRLSGNKIGQSGLPRNLFWSNALLKYVTVGNNALEKLPASLFKETRDLRLLNLQGNDLELTMDVFGVQPPGGPDDDYESELPPLPQEDFATSKRRTTVEDMPSAPNELPNFRVMVGPKGKLIRSQADVMKAILGIGSTDEED